MRKYILLLFIGCLVQQFNAQVTNSVLSNGDWFKFSVDTTGVFKIDRNFLQEIGISTNDLNPKKIHIYGNGGALLSVLNSDFRQDDLQENALFVKGENDGVFNNDDYILFYAKGPHDWQIDPETERAVHRQNIYSDEAFYFITVDGVDGKRIQNRTPIQGNSSSVIRTFDDFVVVEKDERNLQATGIQWFYNTDLNIINSQDFNIPFPNPVTSENIRINVRGVSNSSASSTMNVSVNQTNLFDVNFFGVTPGGLTKARASQNSSNFNLTSDNVNISLRYNNGGNPSANTFLDYIEIIGKKELIAGNNQFSFRSYEQFNASNIIEYQIRNSNTIFQVWDVTDFLNPSAINNEINGSTFNFKDSAGIFKEYIVLNENDFFRPKSISNSKVSNQDLHAVQDINYMVITVPELAAQAQRLADYHAQNSNLTSKVVMLDEIYNEFASGSKDITGIRDFIKHVYTTNTSDDRKLKFVCFFGDASFDYKERTPGNNNIVPVKLAFNSFNLANSYVTDDFYVMLEANEGTMSTNHTIDVASSRIPVSTSNQAQDVVDKILNYYSAQAIGDWRNTVTLLADDTDETTDAVLQVGVESIADEITAQKPVFNIDKIYIDAFVQQNASGGERYPQVNELITNTIEKGTLIFDYFGHGGEDGFASEQILDKPQIQALQNNNTLPLLITVTCDFSRFDNPSRITAGELTLWNKNGGAANMITTTREVFINVGQSFNEDLIRVLLEFDNEDLTIAESLMKVKNSFRGGVAFQKFFIYNFGDPAMKLAIPEANIRITKMNDVDVTQSLDTLKALSRVRFEGVVVDDKDEVLNDFNGTLSTTVFDKIIEKSTLDNDGFGRILNFDTQDSKLFTGKSTVENGVFQFDFIVPRDIKIATGKAKISFYAENGAFDRAGFNTDIVVGGINENAPEDTVGPGIQVFANDESFIPGGNTNASPNIIISLSDSSGINTSITSIGHNIEGVLDGDEANPIVLNDFYETALNDFTNGKVVFKLRDLEEGPHTFKIKAWDTYNNSSEATLNFVVVSDANLNLENVLNYPNPFVNYTEFWFNHNKPNEPLEVQVQIFTVSGKLVKTINQNVQTTGNLSRNITWNGLDDFGNKIGKGVYVYKLKVKSTTNNLVAEKYEKLVILQ